MKKIELGKSGRVHGLKGEVRLTLYNKDNSSLKKGQEVYLDTPQGEIRKVLKSLRFGNYVIAGIEGVSNREELEPLLPFSLSVSEDSLPKLDDNDFYFYQLIGLKALKGEETIGTVKSYYSHPGGEILCLSGGEEIPLVDDFVLEVNVDKGFIRVELGEYV